METGRPSRTLLAPAIRRAAHQLLDTPLILEDPVAVGLVPEAGANAIRAGLAEHQTEESILLRSLFVMRSRFAEDRLAEAAARGVRQYLIVGAGLDTFPWRQPDYARDMHIFLADHVSSLVWTQEKFWERGLAKPGNLTFVPLDLEDGRLGPHLAGFGFLAQPAFCSALGVTQYLEPGSVEALLRFVASLGRGSEIVFSYVPRAPRRCRPRLRRGVGRAHRAVRRAVEGAVQRRRAARVVVCGRLRRGLAPHPGARMAALFCGARRWTASSQLGAIDRSGGVGLDSRGRSRAKVPA